MVTGVLLIVFGLLVILTHKPLAKMSVEYSSELYHIKLGPRAKRFADLLAIFVGLVMAIMGVFAATGTISTR